MAKKNSGWTSEDWFYAGEILAGLAQAIPPVLGASAQLAHTVGKATAEHESRMRELELHEARLRAIAASTVDVEAEELPAPRKRRRRR